MTDNKKIDIPEGYVVEDPDDELREMGMTEDQIKKFNEEMSEYRAKLFAEAEAQAEPITPEKQRLMDIIYSETTTWEEKEAARRELDPDMYDENGNLIFDDESFWNEIEEDINRCYEEMKSKGLAI